MWQQLGGPRTFTNQSENPGLVLLVFRAGIVTQCLGAGSTNWKLLDTHDLILKYMTSSELALDVRTSGNSFS